MEEAVLTLDELTLFRCSEELKNTKKYNNLYDVLCGLESKRITSLEDIYGLNESTMSLLFNEKQKIKEKVVKEWEASGYGFDPNQNAKCDFCNRKNNKYFFNIKNSINNVVLSVGSTCIEKFIKIKGYSEQKFLVEQDKKQRAILTQEAEAYGYSDKVKQFFEAEKYFLSLPILLPYDLYCELQRTISKLRVICSDYKRVLSSEFETEWGNYQRLKSQSDVFVQSNISNNLACKKREVDWIIANDKMKLLEEISQNNGVYTIETMSSIYSIDFVQDYLKKITICNKSKSIRFGECNPMSVIVLYNNPKYMNEIAFQLSVQNLMKSIGCNCIMYNNYNYEASDILPISTIRNTEINILTVIKYASKFANDFGCAFLFDYLKNQLVIYRKTDMAVVSIDAYEFLKMYSKIIFLSNEKIKENIRRIIISIKVNDWIPVSKQMERGIYQRISMLYKEQVKM